MCQRFPEELDDILGADDEEEQDTGAHFTCFTGAKVQILTLGADDAGEQGTGAHFTCFTGAKVQILTHLPQETAIPAVAAVSQPRSQSKNLYFQVLKNLPVGTKVPQI